MIEKIKIALWDELIGKTISEVCPLNNNNEQAVIYFTDGSVAVLKSESDYDSGGHFKFGFNISPDYWMQERIGEITLQEAQTIHEEYHKACAIRSLEEIKRNYPELLKDIA